MLCPQHYQPYDEKLGYCWKCVSAERDPHDTVTSWWWHLEPDVPGSAQVKEVNLWLKKAA